MSNILTDFNTSLQKLKIFNKQIVGNRQNIDGFQREVSEGLNEINAKVNILKGLIKRLQDEIKTSKQNISSNTSLITQKDANVDNNIRIITRLRKEIDDLNIQKQQLESNQKQLEERNTNLQNAISKSVNDLKECKTQLEKMREDNEKEKKQINAQISSIQNSKNDEELAKKKALDLIKQHQERLKANKEENNSLKEQIQTLTAELNALKKGKTEDVEKFDKQRLEQRLEHEKLLNDQLETSRAEIKSLNERNSKIELTIKTLTQENIRLTKENTDLKQENTDLNTKISEATKIINAATQNMNQLSKLDMQSAEPRIAEINQTLTEMIQSLDSTYIPPTRSSSPRSSSPPSQPNQIPSSGADVVDSDLYDTYGNTSSNIVGINRGKKELTPNQYNPGFNTSVKYNPDVNSDDVFNQQAAKVFEDYQNEHPSASSSLTNFSPNQHPQSVGATNLLEQFESPSTINPKISQMRERIYTKLNEASKVLPKNPEMLKVLYDKYKDTPGINNGTLIDILNRSNIEHEFKFNRINHLDEKAGGKNKTKKIKKVRKTKKQKGGFIYHTNNRKRSNSITSTSSSRIHKKRHRRHNRSSN